MSTAVKVIAGRKFAKNNKKDIELVNAQYNVLMRIVGDTMKAVASFRPEIHEAKKLREDLHALYSFCANQAATAYEEEFHPQLMHAIKIEQCDLVNGSCSVSFKYVHAGQEINYTLAFRAYLSPFSTKWAAMVEEKGGNGGTRKSWMFI